MEIVNEDIKLRNLKDKEEEYKLIHKWCEKKDVYEWFEQRILSYDEIMSKYKNKLYNSDQTVLIIEYNNKPIGLLQFYKYDDDLDYIKEYKNIYEKLSNLLNFFVKVLVKLNIYVIIILEINNI